MRLEDSRYFRFVIKSIGYIFLFVYFTKSSLSLEHPYNRIYFESTGCEAFCLVAYIFIFLKVIKVVYIRNSTTFKLCLKFYSK